MNEMASTIISASASGKGGTVGEVVQLIGNDLLLIEAGAARMTARRALSCLVAPEPGDIVLLGGDPGRVYVLAVLERTVAGPVRITAPGDVELVAAGGRLAVIGASAVEVISPVSVGLTAPEVKVTGRTARLVLDHLSYVGQTLTSHLARIKVVGDILETILGSMMTRAKRSYRLVEEQDHLRANDIDHRASGTARLHGDTTIVTGRTLAKVDASQIHVG